MVFFFFFWKFRGFLGFNDILEKEKDNYGFFLGLSGQMAYFLMKIFEWATVQADNSLKVNDADTL